MILQRIPIEHWLNQKGIRIFFLLIICYFSFFIHNGIIYADIMESRNLVTAREIVAEGNWIIPRMNGELRLEKPPLPTWIAAFVETITPDNLPVQRAVAGLVATMLVFFFYGFASMLCRNKMYGMMSAIVLCTSFNILLMGRTVTWDIYCHSFMMGAIYFIFRGSLKKGRAWWEFLCAGVFLGLSFLGKGPVSFYALLLPYLVAYTCFPSKRSSFRGKWGPVGCMVLICLVISFWWPLLLYTNYQEVAMSVWNKESTAWLERSVRPWYYYWKFFVESGIWALFLVTALIWSYWKKRVKFRKAYLFSVCWVFMVLIFLSLLPEKKTRYLLPILIPSALVVAHFFMYYWKRVKEGFLSKSDTLFWRVNTLLVAIIVCILPIGIYILFYQTGKLTLGYFIFLIFLLESIAILLFNTSLKNKVWGFLEGVLLLFWSVEIFVLPAIVGIFNNPDLKSISAVRHIQKLKDVPFYYNCEEELRIEIVYEAGRKILPYCFREKEAFPLLPFVLVSGSPAVEVLPEKWLKDVNLELIGIYDDNKRVANSSLHSSKFVRQVTLISPKR